VDNNILRGKMNSLAEGSGTYYDAWMRVNTVNASANYIEVVCYPDDEVPSGKNYPPCAGMNVARWGNQTDETRQSSLYISSTEGRLVRLRNVTKPIIDITKYGTVIGQMPDVIKALSPLIAEGEDYIYARGVITTNFIEIDPQGVPVATVVDRGDFDENADYYAGGWRDETKKYEISDVWKSGCRWRCAKEGTHTVPRWNNTDWAMKEGNTALTVEFEEMEQLYDADNFHATLTVVARLYNEDITEDIPSENIEWTRYTEDLDGNERTDSDNIWAQRHAGAGRRISLEWEDLNAESYIPPVIRFICTVTVRDGMKDSAVLTYE
jgi:hypothetical protein